jgi:hypothetical protein
MGSFDPFAHPLDPLIIEIDRRFCPFLAPLRLCASCERPLLSVRFEA